LIAPAAALVLLSGCTPSALGVLTPTSGEAEVYGRSVNDGVQVALAEARRDAVLPPGFRVLEVDTGSSPRRAARELRRLAERHRVPLVVGGVTTAEARALITVAERERVVCISPSAPSTEPARRSRFFYRLYATDEVEGRTAARYLAQERRVRRLAVYTDGSPLTRGVEAEFRQHFELLYGGVITDTIHLGDDRWQHRSADAYHANHPQAVYIVGHADSIERVLRHLDARDLPPIRCTTSALYVGDVVRRCGALADGVVFPLPPFDTSSIGAPVQNFVEAYFEAFGEPPDIYAAHGYDAMRLALRCLCSANAVRAAQVRRYFDVQLGEYPGVTGVISFNDRAASRYPVMHCVWNGHVMSCARLRELERRAARGLVNGLLPASCDGPSVVSGKRI
jgi:branched-chain amino acid transport system substrate-binding protein